MSHRSIRMNLLIFNYWFMYRAGWFIDNVMLTLFNFIICVPISYCMWINGSYWGPIARKPSGGTERIGNAVFLSTVVNMCIYLVGGLITRSFLFAFLSVLLAPTIVFIVVFSTKSVRYYRERRVIEMRK